MSYRTEQEQFWSGEFGNQYSQRNLSEEIFASNLALFGKILADLNSVRSIIEYGANIGLNLRAIQQLIPDIKASAVEINSDAVSELKKINQLRVYEQSILDYIPESRSDLVLVKGLLIHIDPDFLPAVYESIYKSSNKYICIAEYYSPTPVELVYRGHKNKLYKRDFAGEMLDKYQDLALNKYGFVYRRDVNFPQDDINWFVLEKR